MFAFLLFCKKRHPFHVFFLLNESYGPSQTVFSLSGESQEKRKQIAFSFSLLDCSLGFETLQAKWTSVASLLIHIPAAPTHSAF